MLTGNTFLDHCWVCHEKFSAELNEHRHHVIPRAFGGVDGPQVSLCSNHHSRLHEIGIRLYKGKLFNELLSKNVGQDNRLIYLATVACNAQIATENDPNKFQVVVFHLKGKSKQQMKELKRVYGRASMQKLMELALNNLHAKHFVQK